MTASPLLVLERAVLVHELLEAAGLPHAIGGALALAYHVGDARATRDIDVNVTADDPEAVFRLLPPAVAWGPDEVAAAAATGQVRLLWAHPDPGGEPIPLDIFFPEHPRFHALVADRAERVSMLGTMVPILRATDLLVFKALFNRRKDWADIEELLRFGKVDVEEAGEWLRSFVGADDIRVARLTEIVAEVS